MTNDILLVLATIFGFIMVIVMVTSVAIPFSYGLYLIFMRSNTALRILIVAIYTILIFLFIKFEMYKMIKFLK